MLRIREQVMLWRVYFEMIYKTFLLFHIHIEQFSVISVRRFILLLLLRWLIPICPRNWYKVPATKPLAPISTALTIMLKPSFSSSFLRSEIFEFELNKHRVNNTCWLTVFHPCGHQILGKKLAVYICSITDIENSLFINFLNHITGCHSCNAKLF